MPRAPMTPPHAPTLSALALSASIALLATPARAHFTLDEPACYSEQNAYGSPQKSAPCGQADPGLPVVETGAITTYVEGQTITLTIHETIFHPGHYRVAIATDQASLPLDPPVTADAASACGSTVVDPAPSLPVLADGLLDHTTAFDGPQTVQITLPPGLTCQHCTLQVIEFMSNHPLNNPGGCFYHHCANVTITSASSSNDAGSAVDAGGASDAGTAVDAASTADAGSRMDAGGSGGGAGGCSCAVPRARAGHPVGWAALAAAIVAWRRRPHPPR